MLGNQIYMSGFTPEELMSLFRDVIKEELDKLQTDKVEKLLSPAETCKIFHIPVNDQKTKQHMVEFSLTTFWLIGVYRFYK